MKEDLTLLENRKCIDKRTGEYLGIVLSTDDLTALHGREEYCLCVIKDGIHGIKSYFGREIENVSISLEPLEMQELLCNASFLFARLRELEESTNENHAEEVIAWNERNDYIHRIAELMNANGLASEFNLGFLKICLGAISLF